MLCSCAASSQRSGDDPAAAIAHGPLEQEAREIQPLLLEQDQLERKGDRLLVLLASDGLFESKGAKLQRGAGDRLRRLGAVLQRYPATRISVTGHTDGRGRTGANAELSRKRADVVAKAFGEAGVPADRIVTHGQGESHPVAPNDTMEGRARNRRIELVIETGAGGAVGTSPPLGTAPASGRAAAANGVKPAAPGGAGSPPR